MTHSWCGKSKAIISILLMLTLGLIIACGGAAATAVPAATPTTTAPGDTGAPTAEPEPTLEPPASTVKTGGFVPMQDYGPPITARVVHEATFSTIKNLSPMFNQLVEYNRDTGGTEDLRGDLATSWDVSNDGMTYTYKLHPDAYWWDGQPVTADDVVFSMESMVNPDQFDVFEGHRLRSVTGMLGPYYQSSRAIDPKTVEITLQFPAPTWHSFLALDNMKIIPKHSTLAGKIQGLHKPEDLNGSGPFLHLGYEKDIKNEYERNPDYFKKGKPRIDSMTHYIIVDVGSIMAAFKSGQVLMTNANVSNLSNAEGLQLEKEMAGRATVYFAGPAGMYHVMFNTEAPPFDNPKVRKAISLAINRQVFNELFSENMDNLGVPFPPNTWYGRTSEEVAELPGFRLLNGEKHPDDIAEAKRLLAEAGYADGFPAVELTARTAVSYVDLAAVVAEQLKKYLDIDATVKTMEGAAGQAAYLAGEYQFAVQGSSLELPDPDAAFSMRQLEGGLMFQWARGQNTLNYPRIKEIFDEQARETDKDKRIALIREAEDLLLEDDAVPGILWTVRAMVVDNRIQGYVPHPSIQVWMKWETIWCDPAC